MWSLDAPTQCERLERGDFGRDSAFFGDSGYGKTLIGLLPSLGYSEGFGRVAVRWFFPYQVHILGDVL